MNKICPECHGSGETIHFVEIDRNETLVTLEKRKGICRTCNGSGVAPMTNADRIRAMTDEELAKYLYYGFDARYCRNDPACIALLDTEGGVPDEKCIGCALKWLEQPWEDNDGEG